MSQTSDRDDKKMFQRIPCFNTIFFFLLLAGTALATDALTEPASSTRETSVWTSPIKLFQRFISRADGPRCSMYPTCSHYASQAFKRHNAATAWVLTCDRLLRCGRDETRRSAPVWVGGRPHTNDSLSANTFWWYKAAE